MKNVLLPFPRKALGIGRSTQTRKPAGSTSNPAPPHARSRPFREVAAPRPDPTASSQPLRSVVRMRGAVAGPPSNLPFHWGKSTPPRPVHHPASGRRAAPAVPSFTVRPGALPAPPVDNSGAKTPDRARAGGVPAGGGAGRRRGPSRGGRRGGRAPAFSCRRRAVPGGPTATSRGRDVPTSGLERPVPARQSRHRVPRGDLDLLEVGWGCAPSLSLAPDRVPVAAPVACLPQPSGGARVPGAAPVSSMVPAGLGGPAGGCFAPSLQAAPVASAAGNLPVCAGPLRAAAGAGGGTPCPSPKGRLALRSGWRGLGVKGWGYTWELGAYQQSDGNLARSNLRMLV